jgi:hypothetical protein
VNLSRTNARAVYEADDFGGAIPPSNTFLMNGRTFPPAGYAGALVVMPDDLLRIFTTGAWNDSYQRQLNLVDTLSYAAIGHHVKVGVDYRRLTPRFEAITFIETSYFVNMDNFLSSRAATLDLRAQDTIYPIFDNLSLFAQDTWAVSPRVTLDYGVRWELNPLPGEAHGLTPPTLLGYPDPTALRFAPEGTPVYKTRYTNVAPRVGISVQLSQQPGRERVLRGGVGLYYDLGSGQATNPYNQTPFFRTQSKRDVPYPIPAELSGPPPRPALVPPLRDGVYVFDDDFTTPRTWQANVSIEQALGAHQTVSASYVTAVGRDLVRSALVYGLPNFPIIRYVSNQGTSDYQALQVQYRRRLSRGVQALASYTLGRATDLVSTELEFLPLLDGAADFDIRHNLATALTFDLPSMNRGRVSRVLLRNWSLDVIAHAQSGYPFTAEGPFGFDPVTSEARPSRLDPVAGVPVNLDDPTAPGGRRVNAAAFAVPPDGQTGTLGRNTLRGFALYQIDLGLQRRIALTGRVNLQLRLEAFNVLNHPNFALPDPAFDSPTFGTPTQMLGRGLGGLSPLYQIGGPRSMQFAAKLAF